MRRDPGEAFDPSRPALIVTYGHTTRRCRPLDRDLLLVGRDRGCDLGLAAPEVAPVHCVVVRGPDGWRVRDCGSRAGTRLNGRAVHEAALRDGDTLQIGPFSFRAHLPGEGRLDAEGRAAGSGARQEGLLPRLQRSRRNLARLALAFRRRLYEAARAPQVEQRAARPDIGRQSEFLRQRLRDCEQRARRLEQAERDLARDREALERERAAFRARVEEAEQELALRREEVEEARRLRLRRQELDHFAAYLRRAWGALRADRAPTA